MKDYFSVQEIASLLRISHSGVLYNIRTGKLKAEQVGKIYIVSKENFGKFLEDHKSKKRKGKKDQTELEF